MPSMTIAESPPAKEERKKHEGKPSINIENKTAAEERKKTKGKLSISTENDKTTEERTKTKGKPSISTDGDRNAKINDLQQRLEKLETMIRCLKEEVKERAMEDAGAGTQDPICNTCLVRKKGAALFPCGHTFCWKCTSELRRGRGPCPSCNQNFWNVISVSPEVPNS